MLIYLLIITIDYAFIFFFFLIFIGQGKIIYKMQVKTLSLSGLLCAQYLCSKNIYANTY